MSVSFQVVVDGAGFFQNPRYELHYEGVFCERGELSSEIIESV